MNGSISNIMDKLSNSYSGLEGLIQHMSKDLENYKSRPGANLLFVDIRKKQLLQMQDLFDTLIEVTDDLEKTYVSHKLDLYKKDREIFARDMCCLYYGVSTWELEVFTNKTHARIVCEINAMLNAEQPYINLPLKVQQVIAGCSEKQLKYTDKPVIPFESLKKIVKNSERDLKFEH